MKVLSVLLALAFAASASAFTSGRRRTPLDKAQLVIHCGAELDAYKTCAIQKCNVTVTRRRLEPVDEDDQSCVFEKCETEAESFDHCKLDMEMDRHTKKCNIKFMEMNTCAESACGFTVQWGLEEDDKQIQCLTQNCADLAGNFGECLKDAERDFLVEDEIAEIGEAKLMEKECPAQLNSAQTCMRTNCAGLEDKLKVNLQAWVRTEKKCLIQNCKMEMKTLRRCVTAARKAEAAAEEGDEESDEEKEAEDEEEENNALKDMLQEVNELEEEAKENEETGGKLSEEISRKLLDGSITADDVIENKGEAASGRVIKKKVGGTTDEVDPRPAPPTTVEATGLEPKDMEPPTAADEEATP